MLQLPQVRGLTLRVIMLLQSPQVQLAALPGACFCNRVIDRLAMDFVWPSDLAMWTAQPPSRVGGEAAASCRSVGFMFTAGGEGASADADGW